MIDIFTQACYRERGPGLALSSALGTQMRASLFFSLEAAFSLFLSRKREGLSLRFLTQFYFHFLRCPKELAANFFSFSLGREKRKRKSLLESHFFAVTSFWVAQFEKEALFDREERGNFWWFGVRDFWKGKVELFKHLSQRLLWRKTRTVLTSGPQKQKNFGWKHKEIKLFLLLLVFLFLSWKKIFSNPPKYLGFRGNTFLTKKSILDLVSKKNQNLHWINRCSYETFIRKLSPVKCFFFLPSLLL